MTGTACVTFQFQNTSRADKHGAESLLARVPQKMISITSHNSYNRPQSITHVSTMKLSLACIAVLATTSSVYAVNDKKKKPRANGRVRNRRLNNRDEGRTRQRNANNVGTNGYGKQQAVAMNEIGALDHNSEAYLEAKAKDANLEYKAANARTVHVPENMDHNSGAYLDFKHNNVLAAEASAGNSISEGNTITAKMADGKTFIIEEDTPPERGSEVITVNMADGKTFVIEEDTPPGRGSDVGVSGGRNSVPPAGHNLSSMDHNSNEYLNLKSQAIAPTPYEGDLSSMDHNSNEYLNLKSQAIAPTPYEGKTFTFDEEDPTPVIPLPNAKTVSMRPIEQAEDLPAEFEKDEYEDIFAEADLATEEMEESFEKARVEELQKLEHQFAEFEAEFAAFEEEYGASEESIFSGVLN